ncbi:nuclease HARBI1 [Labeo rohita]|uniref:Nuclease HARBI1 n=1 Tax=Labeo rohita TaxID=84645 RepID=A0A498P6R1_LABRO|nr:nuclease HARBI1 [Labeo rohita]
MEEILSIVGPDLTSQTTNFRDPIEPKQRLAITLRYLAAGESFASLAYQYRLGAITVCSSVHMTCSAIEKRMMSTHIPPPTEDQWKAIASKFWDKWKFPNCLGAIDGKHITIKAPPNSGSLFFNYKKTFSIVLLALVDADYRFTYIQVGDFGRASDGGVYGSSRLGRGMEAKTLNVPEDSPLPGSGVQGPMPYVIVGDAAFPLKTYLMRPFPGHRLPRWRENFNYRLSSARMVVECAFGILTARWRALLSRLQMAPHFVDTVVMASCILHNFLTNPAQNRRWQDEAEHTGDMLPIIRNMGGNRGSKDAYGVREKFSAFFNSLEGSM